MKKFILILLVCFNITSYATEDSPRLAVVISVDGLQSDYLKSLISSFDDGGIKLLKSRGAYSFATTTSFINTGKSSHIASLMCGTSPSNHGIIGDKHFSTLDDEIINALSDNKYDGINTRENISPRNIMATTIADEIKLYNELSKIFSIAIDPNSSVIMGGHTADAAIWIDNYSGMIATSHYYDNGLPYWAAEFNNENIVKNMALKQWSPSKNINAYSRAALTPRAAFGLDPIFQKTEPNASTLDNIANLKKSPYINDIIEKLAIRALKYEQLGQDNITDLLCVEFTAKTKFDKHGLCAEIEDMYSQLDNNIKNLLREIDDNVGLDNVLIILSAYNNDSYSPEKLNSKNISNGTFNASRSMALLNAYLMAIYGQGKWIDGYNARNIYLNRNLIEENKIKMSEIQEYTAQFMLEFTGIHSAITNHQMQYISNNSNDENSKAKLSHFKHRSGDVIFSLHPGWYEVDDNGDFVGQTAKVQKLLPTFIMGYGIKNNSININIEDIAATICNFINIPIPNASSGNNILTSAE